MNTLVAYVIWWVLSRIALFGGHALITGEKLDNEKGDFKVGLMFPVIGDVLVIMMLAAFCMYLPFLFILSVEWFFLGMRRQLITAQPAAGSADPK